MITRARRSNSLNTMPRIRAEAPGPGPRCRRRCRPRGPGRRARPPSPPGRSPRLRRGLPPKPPAGLPISPETGTWLLDSDDSAHSHDSMVRDPTPNPAAIRASNLATASLHSRAGPGPPGVRLSVWLGILTGTTPVYAHGRARKRAT